MEYALMCVLPTIFIKIQHASYVLIPAQHAFTLLTIAYPVRITICFINFSAFLSVLLKLILKKLREGAYNVSILVNFAYLHKTVPNA